MTRLAIVAAVVAALLIGLVVALRVPAADAWLEDLPGVGIAFEWLGELVGAHDDRSVELVYRLDRPPSQEVLAAVHRRVAPARTDMRGGQLVVTAGDLGDAMHATEALDRALLYRTVRVFLVVYQSDELDRIKKALRKDDQAEKLALSVELDTVGYHLHAPNGMMMVNPAWAEHHHCEGHHYEGTGTSCEVTARERFDAYVHGDPELFIDAHPDALALPADRAFYATDDGDAYELEAQPIEIPAALIASAGAAGSTLELALTPTAAALLARASGPTVELVAEITPGTLHTATVSGNGLALTIAGAAGAADDLAIASAGPHAVR